MRSIAVLGLGYVGLPLARAFACRFGGAVGYDVDVARLDALHRGVDRTGTLRPGEAEALGLVLTADPERLRDRDLYVLAVPTPIDAERRPDLGALRRASRTVGSVLAPGDVVVVESTVYPGVTEEVCGPILAEVSGLEAGVDFKLGYSPERVNQGDAEHTLERVVKVVAGQDAETVRVLEECYGAVVEAGLHIAPSIRVAEAAKVIENVQRDLNIALMNELAVLFDRLGIDAREVLDAAATKWNFHRYAPGLVGGHCIGVDPYYLTAKAQEVGVDPRVILAGRRTNDGMGEFVADRTLALLRDAGCAARGARVAVLGVAFKPDVADARGSRVPDVVRRLADAGAVPLVHDPLVDAAEVAVEHGLELADPAELVELDALVLAVPHAVLEGPVRELLAGPRPPRVVVDVAGALDPGTLPPGVRHWRLA